MSTPEADTTRILKLAASTSTKDELPPETKLPAGYTRYLRIFPRVPGQIGNSIRCETRICLSRKPIQYYALSYAWGDPHPYAPITVDGHRRLIAQNLYDFLCAAKRMPQQFSGVWWWIDALSIDQADIAERMHQVGNMARIFGRAEQVVVWLGEPNTHIEVAKYLDDLKALSKNPSWEFRSHGRVNALLRLCRLRYWQRLWVFQELRHARELLFMCDNAILPWKLFEEIWSEVRFGDIMSRQSATLERSVAMKMVNLRTRSMDTSLWNLLHETADLQCLDIRDKVYAILSVATEGHENIEADYSAAEVSLGHHVLRNKHAIAPPMSLAAVIGECTFLDKVFGYTIQFRGKGMFDQPGADRWLTPGSDIAPQDERFWRSWSIFHGHSAVAELLGMY